MTASVKIINTATLTSDGVPLVAKHGPSSLDIDEAFEYSVNGQGNVLQGQVADAAMKTAWDSTDNPTTWAYCHLTVDQDGCFAGFIEATTRVIFQLKANVPLVLPLNLMLAAVSTSDISGSPAVTAITKIQVLNNSGTTVNYRLAIYL